MVNLHWFRYKETPTTLLGPCERLLDVHQVSDVLVRLLLEQAGAGAL